MGTHHYIHSPTQLIYIIYVGFVPFLLDQNWIDPQPPYSTSHYFVHHGTSITKKNSKSVFSWIELNKNAKYGDLIWSLCL